MQRLCALVEVAALRALRVQRVDDQRDADDHQRQAQQLSHGHEAAEEIAQLRIGHAHELDEDARDAVPRDEDAHERALRQKRGAFATAAAWQQTAARPRAAPRRAARDGAPRRHRSRTPRPTQVGGLAPQLAVDEVRAASQSKRDRRADDGEVGHGPGGKAADAAGDKTAQNAADQPPMEAHAAVVHREDLERMGEVVPVAVEQHVEQAGADEQAEHHADDDGHEVVDGDVQPPAPLRPVHHHAGEQRPDDIGDAVPIDGDRARRERDGVQAMVELVQHEIPLSDGWARKATPGLRCIASEDAPAGDTRQSPF